MITLKNVSKWYGHFQVLTDCSTEVKKGEVVVVCGPSGSGKSTLIKTVNGLEPVQQGEITVDGIVVNDKKTDLAKLRSRVGMVFQHFELFPHLSIIENLTLAQVKVLKRDKAPAREKALKLLERVGLSAHANKFPAQLSGGQQQRVAIARALCMDRSQYSVFPFIHALPGAVYRRPCLRTGTRRDSVAAARAKKCRAGDGPDATAGLSIRTAA